MAVHKNATVEEMWDQNFGQSGWNLRITMEEDSVFGRKEETGSLVSRKCTALAFLSEIWDALRAATEADLTLAQQLWTVLGVIVQSADLTTCYDERGAKYELPKYVLSEPTNLIRDN
ncbi:hypothetical protein CK203_041755 [Vitis vinifera]|uniref:DC-UbP/UBTD2 N-terminal domain-containing protein n=1 Tax=Vitis vinifera TaxID=29760 RepID=A0A438HH16_VITVI|nr:hypothetical protein CK203_041755 [Vitis vinifera]